MSVFLNQEQERAINAIMQGKDIILLGAAGTGKSTVISKAIDILTRKGLRVIICAPTGAAARIVGGRTVHSALDYPIGVIPNNYKKNMISADIYHADVIIVDELSMVRIDLMEHLIIDAKRKQKPAQLILCGDFKQLQPVICDDDKEAFEKQWGELSRGGYAFDSDEYKQLGAEIIHLTEPMRQKEDRKFFENLSLIGNGDYEGAISIMNKSSKDEFIDDIYLFPHKRQVDEKNFEKLSMINKKEFIYKATIKDPSFYQEMQQPQILKFKEGCRVMALNNESGRAYYNGSLGTVISCEKDSVVVRFDENGYICEVHRYEYKKPVYDATGEVVGEKVLGDHIPLTLAYATTHHKSQGQTYRRANIDPHCFTGGQLYTVLSRVKENGNMYLLSDIRKRDLIVSQEVLDYYQKLGMSS